MDKQTQWQGRHDQKDQIRSRVWQNLMAHGAVERSPVGKIPAFRRAAQACAKLTSLSIWDEAQTVKCNPDTPQIPVRCAALHAGKTLFMAVPQLRQSACFVQLTASSIRESGFSIEDAAIAKNALKIGTPITFEDMPVIDLVVVGCVAVDRAGGRTGKGAGFADLELGMLQQFGRIRPQTPIMTTVDSLQIVKETLPMESHDWALDWIVTPEEAIATHTRHPKPTGLYWPAIKADQWQTIPILKRIYES